MRSSNGPSAADSGASSTPTNPSLRNAVFAIVVAIQFVLVTVNGSTTMVLPAIRDGFDASNSALQWYASLFALGFAATLVIAGRLGDLFGTRRILLIGYAALVASWILSIAAPNIWFLLVARLLQGIAGGVTSPQLSAMIQRTFSGHARTRAFAVFLVFAGGGFMVGQLGSGLLTNIDLWGAGWRWAYLPYIPMGIITWLLAVKIVPHTKPGTAGRLDLVGAAALSVVAFLLMFPLIQGRKAGWPVWIFVMLACAIPAFIAFIRYERRLVRAGGDPLVNPILFAIRTFRYGNIITLLVGLLAAAAPLYLILTIQLGFDRDPLQAALLTCPMPFANMFGSLMSAPLMRRFGRAAIGIGAALTILAAVAVLIAVHLELGNVIADQPIFFVPGIMLLGLALGISIACSIAFVLAEVPHANAGSASGVQATVLQLSGAVGIAVYGVAFYAAISPTDAIEEYLDGIRWVMWMTIALTAVQFVILRFIPKRSAATADEYVLSDPELLVIPDLHGGD